VIQPSAMPQGSALFIAFSAFRIPNKPNTLTVSMQVPVVLNNDAVPPCVPTPAPKNLFQGA
jgi:hypothetical protein